MTIIAVSGSSGFVGRHFCGWLSRHGDEPRRLPRPLIEGGGLNEALRGVDAVVHLAARAHHLRDDESEPYAAYFASNVGLTRRVAEAAASSGVRRLVFVSSAGVLGDASPAAGFDDSNVPAPHDDYTRSKLAAEQMLLDEYSDAIQVIIVRPPLVYGPGAPGNFARIVRAAVSGWPLPVGSLRAPRSMISVRNLCDFLAHASRSREGAGRRMLVADAEVTSVADLTRAIATAAGKRARLLNVPPPVLGLCLRLVNRQADLRRLLHPFVLRGTLAAAELNWRPPFRFDDEISWTIAAR